MKILFQDVNSDCGERSDDDTGKKNAAHNGDRAFFEIHIKERGCQCTCPCACARKWDTYEQKQGNIESASGFCL